MVCVREGLTYSPVLGSKSREQRLRTLLTFYICSVTQSQMPGSHAIGATAVSWAPSVAPGALVSGKAPESYVKRLVSSGCDNTVRVSQTPSLPELQCSFSVLLAVWRHWSLEPRLSGFQKHICLQLWHSELQHC